jgi:CubicO group peptidase (beta-lactamase class C family)
MLAALCSQNALSQPMRQGNFYPQQQVPANNYGYGQAQQNNNQFGQQIQQSGNRNSPQGYRQNTPPSGDNFDQRLANIDAMIKERMVTCNVPGYSIGIIKSGQVVFEKCYGWADIERRIPVTNDTIFGLASVTKTFTGVTLLSLVDKGLVGLDDPLEKYVDGLTKPYKNLTVRQLSSMAAGVAEKVEPEVEWKDQLDILVHTPLVSEPGSQYLYSNFSYRLVGSIIAKASGKRYLEMVGETILAPLQMRNTATTVLLAPTGLVAQGYSLNKAGRLSPVEYKSPAVSFAAGMLASNCNDMLRYALGLMSRRMLSEQGYRTLWYDRPALTTGQPNPWAFGWKAGPNPNIGGQHQVFWGGATQGVGSIIIILPESNCAVVALSSLRTPEVHEIGKTAMRMAFGDSSAPVQQEAPMEEHGSSE